LRLGSRVDPRVDLVIDTPAVDRHSHRHVVYGFAGWPRSGGELVVVILDIDEVRLDVDQPVLALEAFADGWPLVKASSRNRALGQRHEEGVASSTVPDGRRSRDWT